MNAKRMHVARFSQVGAHLNSNSNVKSSELKTVSHNQGAAVMVRLQLKPKTTAC